MCAKPVVVVHFQRVICEHEISNIFCACQDGDNLRFFAYITRDLQNEKHYCHVFCSKSKVGIRKVAFCCNTSRKTHLHTYLINISKAILYEYIDLFEILISLLANFFLWIWDQRISGDLRNIYTVCDLGMLWMILSGKSRKLLKICTAASSSVTWITESHSEM